jgi:D-amino-acid dehydrogenase
MHIIGGGVIGLCCAWYLREAGYDVTVIDKTAIMPSARQVQVGCSFGNAGIIVPSHSIPLASPGAIAQGIRWMFNARSPFFIKPRLDPDLLQWVWRFYRSCSQVHVDAAAPVFRDFHLLSKSLYQEFAKDKRFAFDFEAQGSLMLYRTLKGEHEEKLAAEKARELGLQVSELSPAQIASLNPDMRTNVIGGFHYHDDAHLYPGKFVLQLQHTLEASGVKFLKANLVTGFATTSDRITHVQLRDGSSLEVEDVVLAAGAWSASLAKLVGLRLLIQDGKGYSITITEPVARPTIPTILSEARVAVTPMGTDLRIGGTLEVSNFSTSVNQKRVSAILKAMTEYYPDFPALTPESLNVWHGFRPVSADGLPYIGRTSLYRNLIVAAGHAMLGMSLGPATGLLVSEIAEGKKTSLQVELFRVDRHI